ncbi:MAG: dihydropyrimidinase [Anaerolineales bacterium]|nr:dihydropyrimidinase [Anaerolineales bacterium]
MSIIIKSGTLITAAETFTADIHIEDEKIVAIGNNLNIPDAQVIDALGKLVMPGGIDAHTHFDLPMFDTVSSDDHYTGHKAAAFGGTTTVMDFIPQDFDTLGEAVDIWHAKAEAKAAIDFGFHMNITKLDENIETEIPGLLKAGISTLKVFTAYNNRLRLQDGEIFRVLRIAKENGMLTMLHGENGDVIDILVEEAVARGHKSPEWHALTRPAWGSVEAVMRGIALAAQAEAPLYIVHMNTSGGVDQLRYARENNLPVMGETCPPYLFFSIDHLRREDGAKWVCSPPMRSPADNEALWKGLSDGTIQTIGTDHCPFFFDGTKPILYENNPVAIPGKELGKDDFTKIPNGVPGVGDRLPIMWTFGVQAGRITPNQFVALTSTNPAKIFGLYPRKGGLLPGADADIVIWDPEKRLTYGIEYAHHRTDYNLYEKWELVGYPEKVFLRGNMLVDGERWFGRAGKGQFIYRQPGTVVK